MIPYDPFLIKVLLKIKVYESRKQCTDPQKRAWYQKKNKKIKTQTQTQRSFCPNGYVVIDLIPNKRPVANHSLYYCNVQKIKHRANQK